MAKRHSKKQTKVKDSQTKKTSFSEKRQRNYAFGFLIGEY
jgi:hypothetical protein